MSRKLTDIALGRLGRETGTVHKDPGGRVRVCLAYPNEYSVGMSSLGFQGVYALLNARADVYCERVFLPSTDEMAEHQRSGTDLFSLETRTPLLAFDIVAFSVSFENDYPNVLRMLDLARLPLRAEDRVQGHPLVVMGGVCAFSNPEPLAEFFDLIFVGEAEEMLPEFMDTFSPSDGRDATFKSALEVAGVYVPSFYEVSYDKEGHISERIALEGAPEKITRRFVRDISAHPLVPLISTPEAGFSSMRLAEAMRGCPWSCNFCLAGHVFNPPRVKPGRALCAEIAPAAAGGFKVGLIGPSLSDYPDREMVLGMEGVSFSITSLRATPQSAELAALLEGHRSVSIAPEAGSERLRKAINKKITRKDILDTSRMLLDGGLKNGLRLYFMVGLPGEEPSDVEAIVELVREIREGSKLGRISLTLSVFVPKPSTPFQWQPMLGAKKLGRRIEIVRKGVRALKAVSVSAESPRMAHMQGFFSQGDRRLGRVLEGMLEKRSWERAAKLAGIDPSFYTLRGKGLLVNKESLPWDFIDSGLDRERLRQRAQSALAPLGL